MLKTESIQNTEDMNIVALWLRCDKTRWVAGVAGGLFAGLIAIFFAMLMAALGGKEFWFPVKLMASIVLGPSATVIGFHFGAIAVGLIVFEALAMFWGALYAHFAPTNCLLSLLGVGATWAAFSWIFIWNLFLQSFKPIFNAQVSSAAAFAVCMAYGLSLTAVAFFDRLLRGKDL